MPRPDAILIRREWPWFVAVAFVLSLTIWWWPGRRPTPRDSYSSSRPGKLAFFETLRTLHPGVRRDLSSVLELMQEDTETIVLLGPTRRLSPLEWNVAWYWLSEGGRLLYAPSADDPATEIEWLGLTIDSWDGSAIEIEGWVFEDYKVDVLRRSGDRIQAVRIEVDDGVLVVCANDEAFANDTLYKDPATAGAEAYARFAALDAREPIVFAEGISAQGRPGVIGVLFSPFVRRLSLQLVLLAILFAWWGYRTFGPVRPPARASRRRIREHAEALAALHRRVPNHDHLVDEYINYVRQELGVYNESNLRGAHGDRIRRALERARAVRSDGRSRLPRVVQILATLLRDARRTTLTGDSTNGTR